MNRASKIAALALMLVTSVSAFAQSSSNEGKAVVIPLKQIWGYDLPGTRNVRELEPMPDKHDSSFKDAYLNSSIYKIARYLAVYVPEESEKAGPAFVVEGVGKEALKSAHGVFKNREMSIQKGPWPKDTELSLVFYTYATGWHPQIKSVERSPNSITVKYQFIAPQEPAFGAMRFAIIPIGKLSVGTVHVKIEQLPPVDFMGRPMRPKLDAERFVCDSFSFDVQ